MRAFCDQFSVTNNLNVINAIILNSGFIFSYPTKNEQGKNPMDKSPDHLFYNCYLIE